MVGSTFEEVEPRIRNLGWRVGIVVLGVTLAVVACAIIGLAFVRGSWWYAYGTDRALDEESLARLEVIRNEVDASGAAPRAVTWLDAALEPDAHPTDVRTCLLAAQETLEEIGDPHLAGAVEELRAIIGMIRPSYVGREGEFTPYSVPALE